MIGTKVIELLDSEHLVKTGKGMFLMEHTFNNLETAISPMRLTAESRHLLYWNCSPTDNLYP